MKEHEHDWKIVGENTGPDFVLWCKRCGAIAQCDPEFGGDATDIETPELSK